MKPARAYAVASPRPHAVASRPQVPDLARAVVGGGGVARVLELARRHLGMDVAYLAEFTGGKQVYRALDGDATSFGWTLHDGPALSGTYCPLMTAGDIPNAISDAKADPRVRDLAATTDADIGSYVGVPIRREDGTVYGSLCCLSHDAEVLHERDVAFLAMLGELVEMEIAAEAQQAAVRARILDLIEQRRIQIAVQPVVSVATGRVLGVEALSRFPDKAIAPDVVFNEAYRAGLGLDLERLATATALDIVTVLDRDQYLAMNLTPPAALELATRAAEVDDLPYDRLVVEITEHAAVESYAALRAALAPARRNGLRLAIDDAGAGYASLHHIVQLEPDIIKIDRSLINGVASGDALQSVVKAFVALASDLGATTVAEGVEHEDDLLAAADLGVDAVQGYLLARPSSDRSLIQQWAAGWQLDEAFSGSRQARQRKAFSKVIRERRGARTQISVVQAVNAHLEAAGETARVSQGQFSAYEHARERPNGVRLKAIEAALGMTAGALADIFGG